MRFHWGFDWFFPGFKEKCWQWGRGCVGVCEMNNFDRLQKLRVIKLLKELGRKNSEPPCGCGPRTGLCCIVEQMTGSSIKDTFPNYAKIALKWRYSSGSVLFPVPPTKKERNKPVTASHFFSWESSFWTGEYGNMRRMFARYLAREFRKEFK